LSFQYTDAMPPLKKRIGTSVFIISLAAPLMLVLFILFPRVQGPLWGLPSDANAGRTGLSDTISPGNISELAQSDDIAFRVKFIDSPPPKSRLYWRGIVLEHYDGRAWTQNPVYARTAIPATLLTRGAPVRYQVTLEPNGRRWLFALELPGNAPTLANNKAMIAHDRQIVVAKPINDRVRYEAESYVDFILQPQESNAVLRNDLLLPRGYNPATLEFARQLRAQYSDDMQLVKAVLRFFHDEQFSYTLEPPLLGRDSVDEFLFTTRAGFCEHYASAFTVLMRAAGIPSRVVAGYQGGEINPVDGFMAVRQSDAHAWAEVWLQDRGWVRVDPTAAVAPNRIEQNLTSTLPRRTFGALNGLVNLNVGKDSLLAKLRFNWDAVTNAWNQYVLNFSPEHQINFIRKLGFDNADWHTLIMLLFAVGSITLTLIALPLIANRPKRDPVAKLYAQLSQMMSKHGYPRNMHEGPRDYCARLTASDSLLSPEKKVAVKRFLMFYESVQYGTLDAAGNSISQLKSLLSKCR
jgi:transglutaminase-like putative cysteine protease